MATSGNTLTDIMIFYVPLGLMVVLGLIGLLRGVRREVVVSLSIVLSALIIMVWAAPWATDLHDTFTSLGQVDTQTWLGLIVVALITLVAGYGLSSAVVARGPMSAMTRMGGLLVGLANGAALSGWILRNYYNAILSDTSSNLDTFTALSTNVISRSLIIWAGWFPLAVAFVAAIVALVGPFRKARTVVATPSPQTNWQPSPAPAMSALAPTAAIPTSNSQQFTQPYAQQYGQPQRPPQQAQPQGQPYNQQYQQYPPQFGHQPQSAPPTYTQSSYPPPQITPNQPVIRVDDAPPTMPMPTSDLPRSTAMPAETLFLGGMASSSTSLQSGQFPADTASASAPKPKASAPDTGPLGDAPHDAISPVPTWAQPPDSSWLSPPAPKPDDSSVASRSEAPTTAYPVGASSVSSSSPSPAMLNCSGCGALVPVDATFCTECGNRMKA